MFTHHLNYLLKNLESQSEVSEQILVVLEKLRVSLNSNLLR